MSTSEVTTKFAWIPAYHPDAQTVAMPAVDRVEPQTVVVEAVPSVPREETVRLTGNLTLLDQANFGVHASLENEVTDTNRQIRTILKKEQQLAHEDWDLVVGLLHVSDKREFNRERALAVAAATVDDKGKRSATGAYVTGAVTLAEVFNAPISQTDPNKLEVPAVNVEDLQNFTRLALHEGFAELSANPSHGGQKLQDALHILRDAVREVPDFDVEKAGFPALLSHTIYYKAAFPNVRGYENATTKLVRQCFLLVREVLTLRALEQMKAGVTLKDVEASILTNDQ